MIEPAAEGPQKRNEPTDASNLAGVRASSSASVFDRAFAWHNSQDVGSSSEALCFFFLGRTSSNLTREYPRDMDDMGRCIRLIRLIPEWRDRLHELEPVSIRWGALAANWEKIERAHDQFVVDRDRQSANRIINGVMNERVDRQPRIPARRLAALSKILDMYESSGRVKIDVDPTTATRHIRVEDCEPAVAKNLANDVGRILRSRDDMDYSVLISQRFWVSLVASNVFDRERRMFDHRACTQDFPRLELTTVCINLTPRSGMEQIERSRVIAA